MSVLTTCTHTYPHRHARAQSSFRFPALTPSVTSVSRCACSGLFEGERRVQVVPGAALCVTLSFLFFSLLFRFVFHALLSHVYNALSLFVLTHFFFGCFLYHSAPMCWLRVGFRRGLRDGCPRPALSSMSPRASVSLSPAEARGEATIQRNQRLTRVRANSCARRGTLSCAALVWTRSNSGTKKRPRTDKTRNRKQRDETTSFISHNKATVSRWRLLK